MSNDKENRRHGKGRPRSADRHKPARTVRLPLDLYQRLEKIADLNDRDRNREARRAITAHVEAEERRHGIEPPGED